MDIPAHNTDPLAVHREHHAHPREFADHRYVYAVLSRRSGGISIGVNLNPDKRCNFDCIYCQVDRTTMPTPEPVDMDRLNRELAATLDAARDGRLFALPRFADLPNHLKGVRDIALSGDGEPTQCRDFDAIAEAVTQHAHDADHRPIPVVLITNAAGLDRETVIRGVDRIMAHGGAVWGKLDAGTEYWFNTACVAHARFSRILHNLTESARRHPITLQTCWFRFNGNAPPRAEIDAYLERLKEIRAAGGSIAAIQLYTVARTPAQSAVTPLSADTLSGIADTVRAALPDINVSVYT